VDAVADDDVDAAVDPGRLPAEIASDSSVVLIDDDITSGMLDTVASDASLGRIQLVRRWKAVVLAMNKHPLDMRF